jgi:hypothetical protein
MILSSVCLSTNMSSHFNPLELSNKCDTLPFRRLYWVNLATYQDTSPYLSPAIFVAHYTLIPSNPEEPKYKWLFNI